MTKRGPWQVLGTKTVYKNPWVTVFEHKVIQPDGKKGIYGWLEQSGGATVIAMDDKKHVYLTREFRYPMNRWIVEGVSGGRNGKEAWLQTAKRELKEEAGITAKRWTPLGTIDTLTALVNSPTHLFFAENLTFGEPELEGVETLTVLKVPFKDALAMIEDGRITHSATIITLLKIEKLLKKR